MDGTSIRNIILVISYLAMLVINILAGFFPINGITTGQVSESIDNLFAPAGFTFSIWGVIYVLLGGYILLRITSLGRRSNFSPGIREDILVILSSILNISWLILWNYRYLYLSVWVIIALLVILAVLYINIMQQHVVGLDRFLVKLPFSIYFAWITVATIANIAAYLASTNWNGFGLGLSDQIWTVAVVILGAVVGLTGTIINLDLAFGFVFVWAYIGILYRHISVRFYDGKYMMVIMSLILSIISFICALTVVILRKAKQRKISN